MAHCNMKVVATLLFPLALKRINLSASFFGFKSLRVYTVDKATGRHPLVSAALFRGLETLLLGTTICQCLMVKGLKYTNETHPLS